MEATAGTLQIRFFAGYPVESPSAADAWRVNPFGQHCPAAGRPTDTPPALQLSLASAGLNGELRTARR